MRKIREVLRLKHDLKLSERAIALSVRLSRSTVAEYLQRAWQVNISWPVPEGLDDEQLEGILFGPKEKRSSEREPDWAKVDRELKRKGVTLQLLHQEYQQGHPHSYSYSNFALKYRTWKADQGLIMRQVHKAGDKLFVDYAGLTVPITDPHSGEEHAGQVFVATLGASNYTYAEVTLTQRTQDWISSHIRALEYFGGVPRLIVPDNLRAGVKQANFYEPEINPAYAEFARHYGVGILPTRVRKPKDKAKVEVHVLIVEREILAPLRNRTFFSLSEANGAVKELLEALNTRPLQKLARSRKSLFEEIEQAELIPLPTLPLIMAQWKKGMIGLDYHAELEGHFYSVPYQYVHKKVEVKYTARLVEIFFKGKRIALHVRPQTYLPTQRYTTIPEHRPKSHQRYGEISPKQLLDWAKGSGEFTAKVVETILESQPHPEKGYRSCMGIQRLGKEYGLERLEAACKRAFLLGAFSYTSVDSILKKRLDQLPVAASALMTPSQTIHNNIRGAHYYQREANLGSEIC